MIPVLFLATLMQDTTTTSFLKTVDITTGQIQTVYSADRRFEAPNWSRDGRYFLINREGRLYRLPVGGSQLAELHVDLATPRINNDHGISPDGRALVISHEPTKTGSRRASIRFPSAAARPNRSPRRRRVFWHGWSPDGKTLAFVGRRDGEFDIYTIPVTGGDERRITTCTGLDDGPDYSPDGAFIYYNSFCSGKMEIWRMRPDGTESEQLTHDAYSNWFPHPSPDGRWIVYLSFLEDQGQDHPFGRQVKLRLMDLRDRSVRDLTPAFFGGQGTINVPSWSPDSRRVAFVSYEQHVMTR